MRFKETETYQWLQTLNQDARSKAQRRIFAMALAHKRGKLNSKYLSKDIEKLSKLDVDTLEKFAKTKQKKRKKDGTISKRNALPNYMKDGKGYRTKPKK